VDCPRRSRAHGRRNARHGNAVEGRIFATREPGRATVSLERALVYYERTTPAWVPELRLLQAVQGRRRARTPRPRRSSRRAFACWSPKGLRPRRRAAVLLLDQAASLFDDMVVLQLDQRHDPQRALSYVGADARALLDSLGAPPVMSKARPERPPTPASAPRRRGPPARAAARHRARHYASMADRLLSWVLTRTACTSPSSRSATSFGGGRRAEPRWNGGPTRRSCGADGRPLRPVDTPLGSAARRPPRADPDPARGPAVGGVRQPLGQADGTLSGRGPPRRHGAQRVRLRPDLDGCRRRGTERNPEAAGRRELPIRSQSLGPSEPAGGRGRSSGDRPSLSARDAADGPEATTTGFLQGARRSTVVHYAGHAIGDEASTAQLLFASDAETGDSGALDLHELDAGRLRTRAWSCSPPAVRPRDRAPASRAR
jgi:hypothetical protein